MSTLNLIVCVIALVAATSTSALKILVYQVTAGHSHMQFSGALVDALAEAGHEVHMLASEWNPNITNDGTIKLTSSRRLQIKNTEFMNLTHIANPFKMSFFNLLTSKQRSIYTNLGKKFCKLMVEDEELLQWLIDQKFDAALTTIFGTCQYGLFHLANIKPVIGYIPMSASNNIFSTLGISTPSSYTHAMLLWSTVTDQMPYWHRVFNFFVNNMFDYILIPMLHNVEQKPWSDKYGSSFPMLHELASHMTYVLINTNEFTDLPRPISHKVLYLGGIGVRPPKKLNEFYKNLLSLRNRTVIFSFGSIVKTSAMPTTIAPAFRAAFTHFPDITFIWKVDKSLIQTKFAADHANIHLVEWIPQTDLLADERVTTFITHCGQNSLEEATNAGVAMIAIPLFGDQMHNAAVLHKRGVAYLMDKWQLTEQTITDALNAVLYDPSYTTNAAEMRTIIADKPGNVRQTFVKHVEFAAKHKKVGDYLQLEAVNLNAIQLHSLDIAVPLLVLFLAIFYLSYCIVRKCCTFLFRFIYTIKSKIE